MRATIWWSQTSFRPKQLNPTIGYLPDAVSVSPHVVVAKMLELQLSGCAGEGGQEQGQQISTRFLLRLSACMYPPGCASCHQEDLQDAPAWTEGGTTEPCHAASVWQHLRGLHVLHPGTSGEPDRRQQGRQGVVKEAEHAPMLNCNQEGMLPSTMHVPHIICHQLIRNMYGMGATCATCNSSDGLELPAPRHHAFAPAQLGDLGIHGDFGAGDLF